MRRAEAIAQQAGSRLLPQLDASAQAAPSAVRESRPAGARPGLERRRLGLARPQLRSRPVGPQPRHPARRACPMPTRPAPTRRRCGCAVDRRRLHLCRARPAARPEGRRRDQPAHPHRQRAADPGARDRRASRTTRPWRGPKPARSSAAAELAAIDEQIELARNQLAALLGSGPARGQAIACPTRRGCAAFGLPQDLGIEIVGRRPDIVAARLRTEALALADQGGAGRFLPERPPVRADRPAGARHRQSVQRRLHLRRGRPGDQPADLLRRPPRRAPIAARAPISTAPSPPTTRR